MLIRIPTCPGFPEWILVCPGWLQDASLAFPVGRDWIGHEWWMIQWSNGCIKENVFYVFCNTFTMFLGKGFELNISFMTKDTPITLNKNKKKKKPKQNIKKSVCSSWIYVALNLHFEIYICTGCFSSIISFNESKWLLKHLGSNTLLYFQLTWNLEYNVLKLHPKIYLYIILLKNFNWRQLRRMSSGTRM